MKVETFECQETAAEPIEMAEEAIRMIDELDLEGQRALVSKDKNDQPTRCPYSEVSKEQAFVIRYCTPRSVDVKQYSAGHIPVRVLQVIAHAMSIGMEDITVHRNDLEVVDDLIVTGTMALDPDRTYNKTTFLLARWGKELTNWAKLSQTALIAYKAMVKNKFSEIKSIIASEEAALGAIDVSVAATKGMPSYYR